MVGLMMGTTSRDGDGRVSGALGDWLDPRRPRRCQSSRETALLRGAPVPESAQIWGESRPRVLSDLPGLAYTVFDRSTTRVLSDVRSV
jgi:hypothetical protein